MLGEWNNEGSSFMNQSVPGLSSRNSNLDTTLYKGTGSSGYEIDSIQIFPVTVQQINISLFLI